MGNLLAYSGTAAKIRAMKSRLLTDEDYQALVAMGSVAEALAYLKKHPGYRELFAKTDESALHRGEIEKMLASAVYSDFRSIYCFSPAGQRKFLDLYFYRYEVSVLRSCLRTVFAHRAGRNDFFTKRLNFDLQKAAKSSTIPEFTENLKGSIYYDTFSRLLAAPNPTLRDYETAIDLFYFQRLFKNAQKNLSKEEQRCFMEIFGTEADLLNIMWICRSKHYFHMTDAGIYMHLIPIRYHLRSSDIASMVESENEKAFFEAIRGTYYGKHLESSDAQSLQEACNRIRLQQQRKAAKNEPYSAAAVISYLGEKEHEINRITTALECVRYGLSREESLKYIKGV